MNLFEVDIDETELMRRYPVAFKTLLCDRSRYHEFKKRHKEDMSPEEIKGAEFDPENAIIWATEDYKKLDQEGENKYGFHSPITPDLITGETNGKIIQPRCKKTVKEQTKRAKDKAEVFTPSWVCNAQNNLIDNAWFEAHNYGKPSEKGWFNDDQKEWTTNMMPPFKPEDKNWIKYVKDTRLEITCGEAPYLASRYDHATGQLYDINFRIGLLDRKLRIVSQYCTNEKKWLKYAREAYYSIYGYEWQGDSLLLARENLLITFIEYFVKQFEKFPPTNSINSIANIISWNIWQMDGLKFVIPESCHEVEVCKNQTAIDKAMKTVGDLIFPYIPDPIYETVKCPGCEKNDKTKHNGIYAIIRDWKAYEDYHVKDGKKGPERSDLPFIYYVTKNQKN